ncbi:helicase RepA family protein [Solidesulfovibrio sp.]
MIPVPTREDLRAQVASRVAEEATAHGTGESQPGSVRRFALVSASDLCANPMRPRWLVRGVLEMGTLASIYGPSAGMKSFVALDMGLCVASGRDWHGRPILSAGPVIYVCGEGFAGIGKRLRAWLIHYGLEAASVPFYVSNSPVAFLDPDSVAEAVAAVQTLAKDIGAPRLVIIDTLARNFGPGDENSTGDMSRFVAALDGIRVQFDCTVIVVHHTGLAAADRARGASAFRAALDWEYRLEPKGDIRLLSCTKAKDYEPPADMAFEPEPVECGWLDEDGDPISSIVLRETDAPSHGNKGKALNGANRIAYGALQALCTDCNPLRSYAIPVDLESWRQECYNRSITPSTEQSAKQKAFKRSVTALRDGGYVLSENDTYWPSDLPKKPGQTGQDRTNPDICPGNSRTGPDTLLKECPGCPGADHPSQGVMA